MAYQAVMSRKSKNFSLWRVFFFWLGICGLASFSYIGLRFYVFQDHEKPHVVKAEPRESAPVVRVENPFPEIRTEPETDWKMPDLTQVPYPRSVAKTLPALPSRLPNPPQDKAGPQGLPKIAIIIDDMGVDHGRSRQVINLPAPLSLSFLPYATGLSPLLKSARAKGHEIMIHMPMQPLDPDQDPGPVAVSVGMTKEKIQTLLQQAFEAVPDASGLNNHMGSRATADPATMESVMEILAGRGVFFIDSRTGSQSVAEDQARAHGLAYGGRDVFLDHVDTPQAIHTALDSLERIARRRGYAIAIGHPRDHTIQALRQWLPSARAGGFEIVTAGALVMPPKP